MTEDGNTMEHTNDGAATGENTSSAVTTTDTVAAATPPSGLAKLGALFRTDPVKEEQGTWMPVAEGVQIRVRSSQSETARNVSKRLLARYKAAFAVGATLSAAQGAEFEIGFCSEGLVVDWQGLEDSEPLACTVENIRNICTELPHLRRQIVAYSEQLENYRPDYRAAAK